MATGSTLVVDLVASPVAQRSSMVAVGDTAGLIQAVNELAPQYGVDPAAALAVASQEGIGGGIGDSGLAYGPWQDHLTQFQNRGPWYGAGANNQTVQQWAWSTAGIQEALSEMAASQGVKGTSGYNAIVNIATNFERPAASNLASEIAGAWSKYTSFNTGTYTPGTTGSVDTTDPTTAAGTALISAASSSTVSAQPILGSQALGDIASRLASRGFWWSVGFIVLAGAVIIIGVMFFFHSEIEHAAGEVGKGVAAAAA
jgi:hypothetical protein